LTEAPAAEEWHHAVSGTAHTPTQTEHAIDTAGLGAVGAYKALADYTQLGGVLTVFGLPE
jgi:lanthanide-dependent methanol dehydrogenase